MVLAIQKPETRSQTILSPEATHDLVFWLLVFWFLVHIMPRAFGSQMDMVGQ